MSLFGARAEKLTFVKLLHVLVFGAFLAGTVLARKGQTKLFWAFD